MVEILLLVFFNFYLASGRYCDKFLVAVIYLGSLAAGTKPFYLKWQQEWWNGPLVNSQNNTKERKLVAQGEK